MITNTELAILGLVAEGPRHGYQIEQDIAARGMRAWTEIGFSSIYYILNKLETGGWLASHLASHAAPGRRGPARKVYALTAAGREMYQSAVFERLTHPRPRSADFLLALANLPALAPAEVRAGLETYQAVLEQQLREVQAKNEHSRQPAGILPPHVEALFDYSLALLAAELAWVNRFVESLD